MKIAKRSMFTGKVNEMDLDVTPEQIAAFEGGRGLVQDIFPNLTAGEREFLLNGVTPEEWEVGMGPPPDEDTLLCLHCENDIPEDAIEHETQRQWQCPSCDAWNDKEEAS